MYTKKHPHVTLLHVGVPVSYDNEIASYILISAYALESDPSAHIQRRYGRFPS